MTHRAFTPYTGPKKPRHCDLLCQIWSAAAGEPIGILVRVPDADKVYWYNQLYRVRTYMNVIDWFELEIGYSRLPEEANLQITRKDRASRTGANHAADIDLRGVLTLDLPED